MAYLNIHFFILIFSWLWGHDDFKTSSIKSFNNFCMSLANPFWSEPSPCKYCYQVSVAWTHSNDASTQPLIINETPAFAIKKIGAKGY